ncbi:hypothetical protein, partial [Bradyrhizobium sp. NAS80.1]|uniref:hypothetical protein n=1 Tax=Bradyrhizobium sp. NAS80.1 TaxID=1680159 RepID=UPI001AEFB0EE
GSAIAPSSRSALVMDSMTASQFTGSSNQHTLFRRLLEAGGLELLLAGSMRIFGIAKRRPAQKRPDERMMRRWDSMTVELHSLARVRLR